MGVLLLSCSKEKNNDDSTSSTYQATVKENFTDPLKQLENIQVNDYIPYIIKIEDNDPITEGVEYRLIHIQKEQLYHQTLWKDFGLYLKNDNKTPPNRDKKYISFFGKGVHHFYIRPFVAGTFKHAYELQKYINNKPVGTATKLNISFNAVKINLLFREKREMVWVDDDKQPPSMFVYKKIQMAKITSYLYFTIDDGDEENDNYLSAPNVAQSYDISFLLHATEGNKSGAFIANQEIELDHKEELEKDYRDKSDTEIKRVTIRQKFPILPDFTIEYHNIKIKR